MKSEGREKALCDVCGERGREREGERERERERERVFAHHTTGGSSKRCESRHVRAYIDHFPCRDLSHLDTE